MAKRNIRRLRYFVLLFCLWFTPGLIVPAQSPPPRDSSAVISRSFKNESLRELKADPDLNYKTIMEPATSLWDRFWNFIWDLIRRMFSTEEGTTTLVWGLRIFALAGLAFFIWQLRKMRASGVFNSAKGRGMNYSILDEDIHSIDFAKEIADAVNAGNHRYAVRMLYLQSLKKLSDSGQIDWKIDKTNLSYLGELRQAAFYDLFRKLTIQFENNWYGNIPINSAEYLLVEDAFKSLNQQVK